MKLLLTVSCFLAAVFAIDNGLGRKPPMGWRSWKCVRSRRVFVCHLSPPLTSTFPRSLYGANVNQDLIMGIMTGMTSRRNMVDGKPTSLLDLGYITVGLDECVIFLCKKRATPPPLTTHTRKQAQQLASVRQVRA